MTDNPNLIRNRALISINYGYVEPIFLEKVATNIPKLTLVFWQHDGNNNKYIVTGEDVADFIKLGQIMATIEDTYKL